MHHGDSAEPPPGSTARGAPSSAPGAVASARAAEHLTDAKKLMAARKQLPRWIAAEQGEPQLRRFGAYGNTAAAGSGAAADAETADWNDELAAAVAGHDDGDTVFTVSLEFLFHFPPLSCASDADNDLRRRLGKASSGSAGAVDDASPRVVFVAVHFDEQQPDRQPPTLRVVAPRVEGPSLFQGAVCSHDLTSAHWRLDRLVSTLLALHGHIAENCAVVGEGHFSALEAENGRVHIAQSHPEFGLRVGGHSPEALADGLRMAAEVEALTIADPIPSYDDDYDEEPDEEDTIVITEVSQEGVYPISLSLSPSVCLTRYFRLVFLQKRCIKCIITFLCTSMHFMRNDSLYLKK